jgi:hypothetical protein
MKTTSLGNISEHEEEYRSPVILFTLAVVPDDIIMLMHRSLQA